VIAVDPPHRLEFEDGFSDDAGNPNPDLPTMVIHVALAELAAGRTRMTIATTFPSAGAMAELIAMGMEKAWPSRRSTCCLRCDPRCRSSPVSSLPGERYREMPKPEGDG
jgi:hypothetical protein